MDIIDSYTKWGAEKQAEKQAENQAEKEYKRLKKLKDAKYSDKYKKIADKQPVKIMDGLKGYTKKK